MSTDIAISLKSKCAVWILILPLIESILIVSITLWNIYILNSESLNQKYESDLIVMTKSNTISTLNLHKYFLAIYFFYYYDIILNYYNYCDLILCSTYKDPSHYHKGCPHNYLTTRTLIWTYIFMTLSCCCAVISISLLYSNITKTAISRIIYKSWYWIIQLIVASSIFLIVQYFSDIFFLPGRLLSSDTALYHYDLVTHQQQCKIIYIIDHFFKVHNTLNFVEITFKIILITFIMFWIINITCLMTKTVIDKKDKMKNINKQSIEAIPDITRHPERDSIITHTNSESISQLSTTSSTITNAIKTLFSSNDENCMEPATTKDANTLSSMHGSIYMSVSKETNSMKTLTGSRGNENEYLPWVHVLYIPTIYTETNSDDNGPISDGSLHDYEHQYERIPYLTNSSIGTFNNHIHNHELPQLFMRNSQQQQQYSFRLPGEQPIIVDCDNVTIQISRKN